MIQRPNSFESGDGTITGLSSGDNGWLSAYLFFSGSSDVFLKNAVIPCVNILYEKKVFDKYFFIRYFERGQHIRLRFKSEKNILNCSIKPFLIEYFEEYFKNNPTSRITPEWANGLPDEQKWLPNDSIHFFEYEPEYERYGGINGIKIAENQFHVSSQTILAAINESDSWSYEKSLGLGIQLSFTMCLAAGMDIPDAILFFSTYSESLMPLFSEGSQPNIRKGDYHAEGLKALNLFKEHFNTRKDYYTGLHNLLLESYATGQEFEQEWFNYWIYQNKIISGDLREAYRKNQIIIPEYFKIKNKLFFIYFSYLHMTFNRLGYDNRDESYIAFIIKESLINLNKSL